MIKKTSAIPLGIHINASRLSFDRDCIFITGFFHVPESYRDQLFGDTVPTKIGKTRVRDLAFLVILNHNQDPRIVTGSSLEYRDVHHVDANGARDMVKTLEAYERKMGALRERFGHVESFSAWFRRMCDVMGVEKIAVPVGVIEMFRPLRSFEKDFPEREYSPDMAAHCLTSLIEAWCTGVKEEVAS